jgi:glycosyltransferase involved in cell wall biosynthesis
MSVNSIYVNGRFLTQGMTGVQRFAFELTTAIIRLGGDVRILSPSKNIQPEYASLKKNIVCIKPFSGYLWEQITLPLYLKFNKINRLINLCNTAPLLIRPFIYTLHDILFIKYPESYIFYKRYYYQVFCKFLAFRTMNLLTVSNFSAGEIAKEYTLQKNKITVIYNGISTSLKKSKQPISNRIKFLFNDKLIIFATISSFDENKNLLSVISAFKKISNPSIRLLLIGGHIYLKRNLLIKCLEDKRILVAGNVNDTELKYIYKNSNFFISPSRYEGFGIPAIEAQFFGCPVIASNIHVFKEVLGDSAIFFDHKNINGLKNAIMSVCDSCFNKDFFMSEGYRNSKKYSYELSAKKLLSLIKLNA